MRCVISRVYMSCLPRYQGNSSLSQKHRTGLRPPVPYMRTKWTTRRSGGPIVCLGSYLHPHDLNPGYAVKQSRKIAECHNNNKIDLYFIPEKHRKPARKNSKVKRVKLELYTYESDWWFVYIRLASHPSATCWSGTFLFVQHTWSSILVYRGLHKVITVERTLPFLGLSALSGVIKPSVMLTCDFVLAQPSTASRKCPFTQFHLQVFLPSVPIIFTFYHLLFHIYCTTHSSYPF